MTAHFAELQARLAGQPTAAIPSSGRSFPLGAAVLSNGINFSVFSRHASRVELLLFDDAEEPHPTRAIDLEARTHRTYHYWHVFVPGIRAGQLYGYRITGPFAPETAASRVKVVALGLADDHGETDERPMPEPNATRSKVIATKAGGPSKTETRA
jgi:pullulanase/glycogen debranching enzyme